MQAAAARLFAWQAQPHVPVGCLAAARLNAVVVQAQQAGGVAAALNPHGGIVT